MTAHVRLHLNLKTICTLSVCRELDSFMKKLEVLNDLMFIEHRNTHEHKHRVIIHLLVTPINSILYV